MKMKWIRNSMGDWQAIGINGDFLVWKEGTLWRARYWNNKRTVHFLFPKKATVSEAKKQCEQNHYWEDYDETK